MVAAAAAATQQSTAQHNVYFAIIKSLTLCLSFNLIIGFRKCFVFLLLLLRATR